MGVRECAIAALREWGRADAITAVAISGAEAGYREGADSSYDTVANYPQYANRACNGVLSVGPWQVFMGVHYERVAGYIQSYNPCTQAAWLKNYSNSARIAMELWRDRGGAWTAWTMYNNGGYRDYLAEATAAVDAVIGGPTGGNPGGVPSLLLPMARHLDISSGFYDPRNWGNGPTIHAAIDYPADVGTPVRAGAAGEVTVAGWGDDNTGNMIAILHPGGWQSRYLHLSEVWPTIGQALQQGEVMGLSGNTGASTGPHLHLALWANNKDNAQAVQADALPVYGWFAVDPNRVVMASPGDGNPDPPDPPSPPDPPDPPSPPDPTPPGGPLPDDPPHDSNPYPPDDPDAPEPKIPALPDTNAPGNPGDFAKKNKFTDVNRNVVIASAAVISTLARWPAAPEIPPVVGPRDQAQ